ncbi:hypothetical protein [Rothia halotolerans]|uniref:hypothetical protein n=1 Tax=Rothia halotolerans TaxID=405770 RepID=UPI00101C9D16|nr:hypothetical protein [Rothia halotolerans]
MTETKSIEYWINRLEGWADEMEKKAKETEVEQHYYFAPRPTLGRTSPNYHFYNNAEERAEKYRAKARELRAQAADMRLTRARRARA